MKHTKLPVILLATAMTVPTLAAAHDDEEQKFEEAFLYFELNDTDGDLGIHGKVDGDSWKKVKIEAPNDRKLLEVKVKSRLRRQGMTELFFESAEPTFDELDPEIFFRRFPEGVYEWEGRTLDHEEIEGEVFLSHIIPEAPVVKMVGAATVNPGFYPEDHEDAGDKICWTGIGDTEDGVLVIWEHVDESHFDKWSNGAAPLPNEEKIPLGSSADAAGVEVADRVIYYEFVAEIDDTDYKTTAVIPPSEGMYNSWTIPADLIALAEEGEVKFEIIVRVETGEGEDDDGDEVESRPGNQSAVEDCFSIEEEDEEEEDED